MRPQHGHVPVAPAACVTREALWSDSVSVAHMSTQVTYFSKSFIALSACIWALSSVSPDVSKQRVRSTKAFTTMIACVWLLSSVGFNMTN